MFFFKKTSSHNVEVKSFFRACVFLTFTWQLHDSGKLHISKFHFFAPINSKFAPECVSNSNISSKRFFDPNLGFFPKK